MREENPKVSIILPVYNTKKYLEKCLNSIIGQTYTNLEILCIDDGSSDGSEKIIAQYAKKDRRIRAVYKENGGESSARNVGLQMMTGQYVAFIDCDDWIEAEMYEMLITIILREKVDMVASSWYCDTYDKSIKIENKEPVSESSFGREELLHYIYKRDSYRGFAYMWNKLYSKHLFYDEHQKLLLFDEDLALGGDVLYLAKLAFNTRKAYYINKAFYHYNQRENSGCHTQDLNKREDWLEAYNRILSYINNKKIETKVVPWIKRFLAYHSSNVAEMAYNQKDSRVLLRCQKIMKEYEKEYYSTNQQYPDRIERYRKIQELVTGDMV